MQNSVSWAWQAEPGSNKQLNSYEHQIISAALPFDFPASKIAPAKPTEAALPPELRAEGAVSPQALVNSCRRMVGGLCYGRMSEL